MVVLRQVFQTKVSTRSSPIGVLGRLLSSRPETRGLHPVGALARPHREEQENKDQRKKAYPDGCPRRQERLGATLESVALSVKLRLDVQERLVQRPCAASSHPPNGHSARRLGVWDRRAGSAGFQGQGAEVAFSRRWRVGEPTWRSSLTKASSSVGGTRGPAGCLPCRLPDGGGGGGEQSRPA